MKKMSVYARNMARKHGQGWRDVEPDKWAALVALEGSRPYDEQQGTTALIDKADAMDVLAKIMDALDNLLAHRVPPEDDRTFNLLAHAVDVANIRYIQIHADEGNPAHIQLLEAKAALDSIKQRRVRTGRWGMGGAERAVLIDAIELYETVLMASSPKQMAAASDIRTDALRKGKVWTPQKGNA